ncbi:MAG: carboxypeptidase M32 [Anaerolineaceae bacterium]|nr:carboxypeptidase M32 [Anaerolineaceae bacterium]
MGANYDALLAHLKDITNINHATALLAYDQETAMPSGGAAARAQQLATLSKIGHEMFTSSQTSDLLGAATEELNSAGYDSDEASMVRVVQQDFDLATKLPSSFVAKLAEETSLAQKTWAKARQNSDFQAFLPALERIIGMMQEQADLLGYNEHPYDALLDQYERGMTTAQVKSIFDAHRPKLVDLIAQIGEAEEVDDSFLKLNFDRDAQREFALWAVKSFGFDFERGAQAEAVHPFCTNFSVNDVRITTRFNDNWLNPALFGMMHEAGHGMYEQGIGQNLEGTPLAGGTSLGVHESQSRMWENIVGRSKGFWSWALPSLKESFPQLSDVSLDAFYKGINKVERSFIRVEADEATYNLHIILRFELEQDLLTGAVKVADVRDVWNDKFTSFFGITPPDDANGVLQDIHWSAGLFGYFATYALGNLLSVQYYNQALKDHPGIPDEIAQGKFDTLLTWLNENIHKYGRKYNGAELTRRVTGEDIQSDSYIAYLTDKFSGIYGL